MDRIAKSNLLAPLPCPSAADCALEAGPDLHPALSVTGFSRLHPAFRSVTRPFEIRCPGRVTGKTPMPCPEWTAKLPVLATEDEASPVPE